MLNGVYYIKNEQGEMIRVIHIAKFASIVGLTLPTARNLRERYTGGKRRPLKTFNDGTTIWVPLEEVEGYPFYKGEQVYHYDANGIPHFCEECTFGASPCSKNQKAAELKLPSTPELPRLTSSPSGE